MTLPHGIAGITGDWLTSALQIRYPGVKVKSFEILDVVASTTTKVRIKASYNEAGVRYGLPAEMIVKGGLAGLPHEADLHVLYRNEGVFYRDVAPFLDVVVPKCFYADTDETVGLIILEDLLAAGATFGCGAQPLGPDLVARALDYQASYHAKWWGSPDAARFPLMAFETFFDWFWNQSWLVGVNPLNVPAKKPGDPLLVQARAAVADLPAFIEAVMAAHRFNHTTAQCLVHVDPHPGNMYFDAQGAPHWLDWQLSSWGNWAWDVAYFMIGALTIEDRRKHEQDLLAHYLACLKRHGVAEVPTRDEAWLGYRRNAIWGISWALVPEQMQSAANGNPIIERFAAAIKDLETLPALGLSIGRYDFKTQ